MKILLVTMEFPPFKGGVGNYYYNLIKVTTGFEFTVLTAHHRQSDTFDSNQSFKIIRRILFYQSLWPKWLRLFFQIKKIIKQESFDLIWVGQVLPVGTVCYLINKIFKIPYFVSTHGMDVMLPQQSARKKKLMLKVLRSAAFITANSNFTRDRLLKLGLPGERIEVVYPCAHILQNRSTAAQIKERKEQYGFLDKKTLLSVGRLVKRKGHDIVLEAISTLTKEFPDLNYLIIGDGPEKGNIKGLITKYQLQNRVKILDEISDEELAVYYQLADLFIMPSRDIGGDVEGFGIVYLEAAGFGLPVIAGRSGGIPEAVLDGQTGILVNPKSPAEIKAALIKFLTDQKLRERLSSNAYQLNRGFNWQKQASKLISLIKHHASR